MNFLKKIGKRIGSTVKKIGKNIYNTVNKIGKTISNISKVGEAVKKINATEALMAQIARASYNNGPDIIGPYRLIKNYSNSHHLLYSGNNQLVISFRGTKEFKDIGTDIQLIVGKESESERFNNDLQYYDEIRETWPSKNIILTGHSLGGSIVLYIATKRNIYKGYAFNPGVSFSTNLNAPNVDIIRTTGDVMSMLSHFKDSKANIKNIDNSNLFTAHTVKNFIN